MTTIVLIEKSGNIKELKAKKISTDTLHSKCGFRSQSGFEKRTTWNVDIESECYEIELWARGHGKAGSENKYDFPPPVDTALYFGTCCLLRKHADEIVDLSANEWKKIYEELFGGFEDIADEETESEDELENVDKELKTKTGYLKDGFVVSTDSDSTNEEQSDEADSNDDESDNSSVSSEIQTEIYSYSDDE